MEFLETKSISSEANSSWDEINSMLDITEEILCKVKEMEIETFQIESKKKKVEREMERTSVTCGATHSGLIYM